MKSPIRWLSSLAFLVLPLATGIGFLTYLAARWYIHLTITLMIMTGLGGGALVLKGHDRQGRIALARRMAAGLCAGLLATAAYDLVRLIVVKVFHFTFWPFDIFTLFGKILVHPGAPPWVFVLVGVAFHICNGIGFGMAYTLALKRPGLWTGLLWAAFLEILMISYYPGWLHLQAVDELLSVSIFGHMAYGTVLGLVARRLVREDRLGMF